MTQAAKPQNTLRLTQGYKCRLDSRKKIKKSGIAIVAVRSILNPSGSFLGGQSIRFDMPSTAVYSRIAMYLFSPGDG